MPPTFSADYVLIFQKGTSSKFWRCQVLGNIAYVTYGRIGGTPTRQPKPFGSNSQALAYHSKMVREKLNKGYERSDDMDSFPGCTPILPDAPSAPPAVLTAAPLSAPPSAPVSAVTPGVRHLSLD